MIFQPKPETSVEKHVSSLQETQLVAKLNKLNAVKSEATGLRSCIKKFFTERIPFSFKHRLRQFIPFIRNDYQISDEAHVDRPEEDLLPVWTDEMESELINLLKANDKSTTLVTAFKINITKGDILTLNGTNWLNDNVSSEVCFDYLADL